MAPEISAIDAIVSTVGEVCSPEAAGVAAMRIGAVDDEPPVSFIVWPNFSPGRTFLQGARQRLCFDSLKHCRNASSIREEEGVS